jgi:hypothetical protein
MAFCNPPCVVDVFLDAVKSASDEEIVTDQTMDLVIRTLLEGREVRIPRNGNAEPDNIPQTLLGSVEVVRDDVRDVKLQATVTDEEPFLDEAFGAVGGTGTVNVMMELSCEQEIAIDVEVEFFKIVTDSSITVTEDDQGG